MGTQAYLPTGGIIPQEREREKVEILRNCPFCGNSDTRPGNLQGLRVIRSEVRPWGGGISSGTAAYYVQCGKCYARGGSGVTGYNGLTGTETSEDQARQLAVKKWNSRTA